MEHIGVLRYFARPFQTAPLILVAIFSFLLAFGISGGLWGVFIVVVIGSWFFKYAFMLLDHVAEGKPEAPVLSPEAANPAGEKRPLMYFVAAAIFYAGTAALQKITGPNWTSALRLLGIFMLPAVAGAHVVTGSFLHAINPVATATMIWRMGSGYVLVLCVAFACWIVGRFVVVDAGNLSLTLRLALLMLLWLAMFSVLGGVIYERRHDIGFEPTESPERRQERDDKERDRLRDKFIDTVFGEYRAGAYLNAWESIQRHIRSSADPLAEYLWIYERIAGWPNARLANRVAQELLPLLLTAQRNGTALEIAKERVRADADFRPSSGDQLVRLVHLARDGGERSLARMLLHDFDRRFPNDPARNAARQLADQLAR